MKTLFRTWMNEGNDKAAATLLKNQAYWSGRVEKAQLNATGYFANSLVDRNKVRHFATFLADLTLREFQGVLPQVHDIGKSLGNL